MGWCPSRCFACQKLADAPLRRSHRCSASKIAKTSASSCSATCAVVTAWDQCSLRPRRSSSTDRRSTVDRNASLHDMSRSQSIEIRDLAALSDVACGPRIRRGYVAEQMPYEWRVKLRSVRECKESAN